MPHIIALNSTLRNFQGGLGIRKTEVACLANPQKNETPPKIITFVKPDLISKALENCLNSFHQNLNQAHSLMQLAETCAKFWICFIAIHPFLDANGRTAKAYLKETLYGYTYKIDLLELLDRYLITGDHSQDLPTLTKLFAFMLSQNQHLPLTLRSPI